MKFFIPLMLLIFILGCNPKQPNIRGSWISKYRLDLNQVEESKVDPWFVQKIFDFREDSLIVRDFYSELSFDTNETGTRPYSLGKGRLIIHGGEQVDEFDVLISEDTMVLSRQEDKVKIVFERLSRSGAGVEENRFYNYLISNQFTIESDTILVEFSRSGLIITSAFDYYIGDDELWQIDNYGGELILVFDGTLGSLIQLWDWNQDGFKCKQYGIENRMITFKKAVAREKFRVSDLLGKWIERNPSASTTFLDDKRGFSPREILTFEDSLMVNLKYYQSDSTEWALNLTQDVIYFPKSNKPPQYRKWKIVNLTSHELVLTRKLEMRNAFNEEYETISFGKL